MRGTVRVCKTERVLFKTCIIISAAVTVQRRAGLSLLTSHENAPKESKWRQQRECVLIFKLPTVELRVNKQIFLDVSSGQNTSASILLCKLKERREKNGKHSRARFHSGGFGKKTSSSPQHVDFFFSFPALFV